MTQTIIVSSASMEANPLYAKLRSKFANPIDHRTVGEAKVQQAIRDGYEPFTKAVRRPSDADSSMQERHVTRANSLPTDVSVKRTRIRQSGISGSAIAILVLCSVLLLFLFFSGIHISELNNELNGLQNNANELRVEDRNLTLSVADIEDFAAEGACNNGDSMEAVSFSNLHRAFSGE